MKRFKCTVIRTDEYIIELDENIFNEEWMEEFKKHFYDLDTLEEHAEFIAQYRAKFGDLTFIEGYGIPLINGEVPWGTDKDYLEKGINIIIESEDQECEVNIVELGD